MIEGEGFMINNGTSLTGYKTEHDITIKVK